MYRLFSPSILARALFACSLLIGTAAIAEIAPKYYAESQTQAPEAITITVDSVEASYCWFNRCKARDVTVKATVKTVTRTQSGLKPGQQITIVYQNRNMRGMSGPRPIRVLEKGETTPAFLAADGKTWRPAARGASFQAQIKLGR